MDVWECYRKAEECAERARRAQTRVNRIEWYRLAASWIAQAEQLRDRRMKQRRQGATSRLATSVPIGTEGAYAPFKVFTKPESDKVLQHHNPRQTLKTDSPGNPARTSASGVRQKLAHSCVPGFNASVIPARANADFG